MQVTSSTLRRFQQSYLTLNLNTSQIEKEIFENCKQLAKKKEQLEKEVVALIKAKFDNQLIQNLESIPGISGFMCSLILFCLNPVQSVKGWIGFIGLDVSVCQSGTWIGKGKLTKRGNPYFRKRLFMCAMGAVIHYPEFRQIYESLKSKGRKHPEAINIIARKLLKISHAVIVNKTGYNSQFVAA